MIDNFLMGLNLLMRYILNTKCNDVNIKIIHEFKAKKKNIFHRNRIRISKFSLNLNWILSISYNIFASRISVTSSMRLNSFNSTLFMFYRNRIVPDIKRNAFSSRRYLIHSVSYCVRHCAYRYNIAIMFSLYFYCPLGFKRF